MDIFLLRQHIAPELLPLELVHLKASTYYFYFSKIIEVVLLSLE